MRTLILTALALTLAACNTISGAGEDLGSMGKAIKNTAEDAKK